MLETLLLKVLLYLFGNYVEGLSSESLQVSIWQGTVELRNLKLKRSALDFLELPVVATRGVIGELKVIVPWRNLGTQRIEVIIKDLLVLVDKSATSDAEKKRRRLSAKLRQLSTAAVVQAQNFGQEHEIGSSDSKSRLLAIALDNLYIHVENVHIRYEDVTSQTGRPFAIGFTVQELQLDTTNARGESIFVNRVDGEHAGSILHRTARISNIACYWEPLAPSASLGVVPEAAFVAAMRAGISSPATDPTASSHIFLLKPCGLRVVLAFNDALHADKPQTAGVLELEQIRIHIDRSQYENFCFLFQWMKDNELRDIVDDTAAEANSQNTQLQTTTDVSALSASESQYVSMYKRTFGISSLKPLTDKEEKLLHDFEADTQFNRVIVLRSVAEEELRRSLHVQAAPAPAPAAGGGWGTWVKSFVVSAPAPASSDLTQEERTKILATLNTTDIMARSRLPKHTELIRFDIILGSFMVELADPESPVLRWETGGCFQFISRPTSWELAAQLGSFDIADLTAIIGPVFPHMLKSLTNETRVPALARFQHMAHKWGSGNPVATLVVQSKPLDDLADIRVRLHCAAVEAIGIPSTIQRLIRLFRNPVSEEMYERTVKKFQDATADQTRSLIETLGQRPRMDIQVLVAGPRLLLPAIPTDNTSRQLCINLGTLSFRNFSATSNAPRSAKVWDLLPAAHAHDHEALELLENVVPEERPAYQQWQLVVSSVACSVLVHQAAPISIIDPLHCRVHIATCVLPSAIVPRGLLVSVYMSELRTFLSPNLAALLLAIQRPLAALAVDLMASTAAPPPAVVDRVETKSDDQSAPATTAAAGAGSEETKQGSDTESEEKPALAAPSSMLFLFTLPSLGIKLSGLKPTERDDNAGSVKLTFGHLSAQVNLSEVLMDTFVTLKTISMVDHVQTLGDDWTQLLSCRTTDEDEAALLSISLRSYFNSPPVGTPKTEVGFILDSLAMQWNAETIATMTALSQQLFGSEASSSATLDPAMPAPTTIEGHALSTQASLVDSTDGLGPASASALSPDSEILFQLTAEIRAVSLSLNKDAQATKLALVSLTNARAKMVSTSTVTTVDFALANLSANNLAFTYGSNAQLLGPAPSDSAASRDMLTFKLRSYSAPTLIDDGYVDNDIAVDLSALSIVYVQQLWMEIIDFFTAGLLGSIILNTAEQAEAVASEHGGQRNRIGVHVNGASIIVPPSLDSASSLALTLSSIHVRSRVVAQPKAQWLPWRTGSDDMDKSGVIDIDDYSISIKDVQGRLDGVTCITPIESVDVGFQRQLSLGAEMKVQVGIPAIRVHLSDVSYRLFMLVLRQNLQAAPRYHPSQFAVHVALDPAPWIPDSASDTCMVCHSRFSVVLRRMRCRKCGRHCCRRCASVQVYEINQKEPVQICTLCASTLQKKRRSSVAAPIMPSNIEYSYAGGQPGAVIQVDVRLAGLFVDLSRTDHDQLVPFADAEIHAGATVNMTLSTSTYLTLKAGALTLTDRRPCAAQYAEHQLLKPTSDSSAELVSLTMESTDGGDSHYGIAVKGCTVHVVPDAFLELSDFFATPDDAASDAQTNAALAFIQPTSSHMQVDVDASTFVLFSDLRDDAAGRFLLQANAGITLHSARDAALREESKTDIRGAIGCTWAMPGKGDAAIMQGGALQLGMRSLSAKGGEPSTDIQFVLRRTEFSVDCAAANALMSAVDVLTAAMASHTTASAPAVADGAAKPAPASGSLSVELECESIELTLLDDTVEASSLPFVRVRLPRLRAQGTSANDIWNAQASLAFATDSFNRSAEGWEPQLAEWRCAVEAKLQPTAMSLTLSAEQELQATISDTFLRQMNAMREYWFQHFVLLNGSKQLAAAEASGGASTAVAAVTSETSVTFKGNGARFILVRKTPAGAKPLVEAALNKIAVRYVDDAAKSVIDAVIEGCHVDDEYIRTGPPTFKALVATGIEDESTAAAPLPFLHAVITIVKPTSTGVVASNDVVVDIGDMVIGWNPDTVAQLHYYISTEAGFGALAADGPPSPTAAPVAAGVTKSSLKVSVRRAVLNLRKERQGRVLLSLHASSLAMSSKLDAKTNQTEVSIGKLMAICEDERENSCSLIDHDEQLTEPLLHAQVILYNDPTEEFGMRVTVRLNKVRFIFFQQLVQELVDYVFQGVMGTMLIGSATAAAETARTTRNVLSATIVAPVIMIPRNMLLRQYLLLTADNVQFESQSQTRQLDQNSRRISDIEVNEMFVVLSNICVSTHDKFQLVSTWPVVRVGLWLPNDAVLSDAMFDIDVDVIADSALRLSVNSASLFLVQDILNDNLSQKPSHMDEAAVGCAFSVPYIPPLPSNIGPPPSKCVMCRQVFSLVQQATCCASCGIWVCLLCAVNKVYDKSSHTARRLCKKCFQEVVAAAEAGTEKQPPSMVQSPFLQDDSVQYSYEQDKVTGSAIRARVRLHDTAVTLIANSQPLVTATIGLWVVEYLATRQKEQKTVLAFERLSMVDSRPSSAGRYFQEILVSRDMPNSLVAVCDGVFLGDPAETKQDSPMSAVSARIVGTPNPGPQRIIGLAELHEPALRVTMFQPSSTLSEMTVEMFGGVVNLAIDVFTSLQEFFTRPTSLPSPASTPGLLLRVQSAAESAESLIALAKSASSSISNRTTVVLDRCRVMVIENPAFETTQALVMGATARLEMESVQNGDATNMDLTLTVSDLVAAVSVSNIRDGISERLMLHILQPAQLFIVRQIAHTRVGPRVKTLLAFPQPLDIRLSIGDLILISQVIEGWSHVYLEGLMWSAPVLSEPVRYEVDVRDPNLLSLQSEDPFVVVMAGEQVKQGDVVLYVNAQRVPRNAGADFVYIQIRNGELNRIGLVAMMQHVQVTSEPITITLVNDVGGGLQPLLRTKVTSFVGNMYFGSGVMKHGTVSMQLAADVFNLGIELWEPLIEPWVAEVHAVEYELEQADGMRTMRTIRMSSANQLLLNGHMAFAPALRCTLGVVDYLRSTFGLTKLPGGYAQLLTKRADDGSVVRSTHAQYVFLNNTGHAVTLTLLVNNEIFHIQEVGAYVRTSVLFPAPRDSLVGKGTITALAANIHGMDNTLADLPLNRVGSYPRPVHSSEPELDTTVVWVVSVENGQKTLELRSNRMVCNRCDVPVDISLRSARGVVTRIGTAPPGGSLSVPVFSSNEPEFCVRGREHHDWSMPLAWEASERFSAACSQRGKTEMMHFHVNVTHGHQTWYAMIAPPVVLHNLLPVHLECQVQPSVAGAATHVYVMMPGIDVCVYDTPVQFKPQITLMCGTCASTAPYVIGMRHLTIGPVVTSMNLTGRDGWVPLSIEESCAMDTGGQFHVTIFASTWLLDQTGLGLLFSDRDDGSLLYNSAVDELIGAPPLGQSKGLPETITWATLNAGSVNISQVEVPAVRCQFTRAGQSGVLVLHGQKGRSFELSVTADMCPAPFNRSLLVRFRPRFTFVNKTPTPLFLRQIGSPRPLEAMPDGGTFPFYWKSDMLHRFVEVGCTERAVAGQVTQTWSGAFNPEELDDFPLAIGSSMVVRVSVEPHSKYPSSLMIEVNPVTDSPPIRVKNMSSVMISVAQSDSREWMPLKKSGVIAFGFSKPNGSRNIQLRLHVGKDISPAVHLSLLRMDTVTHELGAAKVSINVGRDGPTTEITVIDFHQAPSTRHFFQGAASSTRFELTLSSLGLSLIDAVPLETIYMFVKNVTMSLGHAGSATSLEVAVGSIQVDDHLPESPCPVLLSSLSAGDNHDSVNRPFLCFSAKFRDYTTARVFDSVVGGCTGVQLWLYKGLLHRIDEVVQALGTELSQPVWTSETSMRTLAGLCGVGPGMMLTARAAQVDSRTLHVPGLPMIFEVLRWSPLPLIVSFDPSSVGRGRLSGTSNLPQLLQFIAGSVKITEARVRLSEIMLDQAQMRSEQLMAFITMRIAQDMKAQMAELLGATDTLGNPKAVWHRASEKAKRGDVVGGAMYALLTPMSAVSGAVSRGLAHLTFDEQEVEKQNERASRRSSSAVDSFAMAAESLGGGVMRGLVGLVAKPVQGAMREGGIGFVKGVGQGVAGVVANPVAGSFAALSRTLEGVRGVVGLDEVQSHVRPSRPMYGIAHRLQPYDRVHADAIEKLASVSKELAAEPLINVVQAGSNNVFIVTVFHVILMNGTNLRTSVSLKDTSMVFQYPEGFYVDGAEIGVADPHASAAVVAAAKRAVDEQQSDR